jgi:hypothetical protein
MDRPRADERAPRPDNKPGEAAGGEAGEGAHESRPRGDATDSEPSDDEWLRSLPIRADLADPTEFDAEARAWRRARPLVEELRRVCRPSDEDLRRARAGAFFKGRFAYAVAGLTGVKSPEQWQVCDACGGTGESRSVAEECDDCNGAGYKVTHEGDDRDGEGVRS